MIRLRVLTLLYIVALLSLSSANVFAENVVKTFNGSISNAVPFQEIPFSLSTSAIVSLDITSATDTLDTLLYLVDSTGNIIVENDDRSQLSITSAIADVRLEPGDYTVVVTRYGVQDGNSNGDFTLELTVVTDFENEIVYATEPADLEARGFPKIVSATPADWTIMVYLGGDTNLEAALMTDFDEFERAGGSSQDVRIIALIDRSPNFSDANADWSGVRLYEISADTSQDAETTSPPTIDSQPLADFGMVDSGRGELLAQFMVWAVQAYPAEHYAVSIGGHGGGWAGLVVDESANSIIALQELDKAFAVATETAQVDQFDLLINDACLMGSIEYYSTINRYFHRALGSPEIVIEPALDLTTLTNLIKASPTDVDTFNLGRTLVENYLNAVSTQDGSQVPLMSFALTDLDRFDRVTETVEAFAQLMNTDPVKYNTLLSAAYTNTYKLAAYVGYVDKIDLGHFMQQIIALTNDPAVIDVASQVLQAIENARLYGDGLDIAKRYTSYYNIYFPKESRFFNPKYFEQTPLQAWASMLTHYYSALTPRLWSIEDSLLAYHPPQKPKVTITGVYPEIATPAFPPTFSLEIVGNDISDGAFTVDRILDDGRKIRLLSTSILTEVAFEDRTEYLNNWKSGLDLSNFSWVPFQLPQVTDGTHTNNELIVKVGDLLTLNGRYRQSEKDEWQNVSIIFDKQGYASQIVTFTELGTFAPLIIPTYSEFEAYQYEVQADGDIKAVGGNAYDWTTLRYTDEKPQSGQYELGFLIKTYGGNSGFGSTQIQVDSDGIDTKTIGFADVESGYVFQYPQVWNAPTGIRSGVLTQALDQTERIQAFVTSETSDIYTVLDDFLNTRNYTLSGSSFQTTFFGKTALEFAYIAKINDDTTYFGKGLVTIHRTSKGTNGLVFATDTLLKDNLSSLFTALKDNVQLFDAENFDTADTRNWDYGFLPRNLPYPIPDGWISTNSTNGFTTYTPSDASDGLTFAAIKAFDQIDTTAVLDELITTLLPNATAVNQRPYYGTIHTWTTVSYEDVVDNQPVVGRIYVTRVDSRTYAWHFQTVTSEASASLFRDIFEPIVDGFVPSLTVSISTNDVSPAYFKSALAAAQTNCSDVPLNTYCVGNGTLSDLQVVNLQPFAKPSPILFTPSPAYLGETRSLETLQELSVGILEDNTVDGLSIGVLNIEGLQLIAFGGTTLINKSTVEAGKKASILALNNNNTPLNVRQDPNTNAPIVNVINAFDSVTVIARLENNAWLRVKTTNGVIGWVNGTLLQPQESLDLVPVNTPTEPYFAPMQNIEVLFSGDMTDPTLLNGLLIVVPKGISKVRLGLNDYEFEFTGGTVLFWRANTNTIEETNLDSAGSVELIAKRRPSKWNSNVLKGATRVRQLGVPNAPVLTAVAGMSLVLDGTLSQVQMTMGDVDFGATFLTALPENPLVLPPLEVEDFIQLTEFFFEYPDFDLVYLEELPYNYLVDEPLPPLFYIEENTVYTAEPTTIESVPTETISTEPPSNLCDAGNEWGDGRCDDPDPAVREYWYRAGFYVAQFRLGNIPRDQVPAEFASSLPPEPQAASTVVPSGIPGNLLQGIGMSCSSASAAVNTAIAPFISQNGATLVSSNFSAPPDPMIAPLSTVFTPTSLEIAVSCTGAMVAFHPCITFQATDSNGIGYGACLTLNVLP